MSHWPYGQPALAPGAVSPRLPTISQITCLLPFLVCQGALATTPGFLGFSSYQLKLNTNDS